MKKLAERWLSYANKDLLVARGLVEKPEVYSRHRAETMRRYLNL